jgi:hypothetical protein
MKIECQLQLRFQPRIFKIILAALKKQPGAVLAYCCWENSGFPGSRGEPRVPPNYKNPGKISTLLEGCRLPIHTCLTKYTAIIEASGFNTHLTACAVYYLKQLQSRLGLG